MRTLLSPFLLTTLLMSHPTFAGASPADPPPQPDAARILMDLRRLGIVGRVLYIAAHPDDENTNLLAYLQNNALVRTAYLSITRGDGGQNLIGAEQGPLLGLIRTQELLAARRIDGAEQFFTRARDFGFSKSPEETMKIWGREAVLADVVAVIRRFRPDVVITRFPPERGDTHGHHTASAVLAVAAFRAAGDPGFHPEQLGDGVEPWQATRLLWNKSSWNLKPGEDLSGFAKLDVGTFNPLLGVSIGELAADSRSMHKSQGFGVARVRGPIVEYFKVLDEAFPARGQREKKEKKEKQEKATRGLLTGLDLTWGRFKGTARLRGLTDRVARVFSPGAPNASIPLLLEIDRALETVPDASFRAQKKREVADLVLACAGLHAEATAVEHQVAPGEEIDLVATVVNRSPAVVTLDELRFPFADGAVKVGRAAPSPTVEVAALPLQIKRTVRLPADQRPTTPYWLETPPEAGLYHVADPKLIGAPESEPPLRVDFILTIAGRPFTITRGVEYKWTDPVMGERHRSVEVTPIVSVRPDATVLMFSDARERVLDVHLTGAAPGVSGLLRPVPPVGWVVEPATAPFKLVTKGGTTTVSFRVSMATRSVAAGGNLRVVAEVGGASYARGVVHVEHPHIPIQTWLADADVRLVPVSLATGGTKIGYVPGPGDEVPASLRRVGYDVTLLDESALGAASLARFDAVVTGVRAFNTSDRLRAAHGALMAYVEGGGTLVVQYNTNNRLAPLGDPIGPWPFEIGRDRVTDETAAVTFAGGKTPALTTPNTITARDFEGWIQERGLYFAEKWDPRYQTVLSMHDPDEAALAGAVLWARHGKGTFVYTGLAFFRQLPAGVPGAFRLFANLLAGGSAGHGR
jgi:LmbE family N-acetylglucosaminyl deacetylase